MPGDADMPPNEAPAVTGFQLGQITEAMRGIERRLDESNQRAISMEKKLDQLASKEDFQAAMKEAKGAREKADEAAGLARDIRTIVDARAKSSAIWVTIGIGVFLAVVGWVLSTKFP